jgi:hypothetical protein
VFQKMRSFVFAVASPSVICFDLETHRGVGFFVGRGVVGLFVGDRVYLQLVSEKHDSPSLIRSKKRCIRNT